jgi:hypothetical protein
VQYCVWQPWSRHEVKMEKYTNEKKKAKAREVWMEEHEESL